MKTSAAMNEKPTKKKEKGGKFEKTTRIYMQRCNRRWNAVQMEGVCIIIGKEK